MYSVVNNVAHINGKNGIYDGVIKDSSVRYGRNAVDNHNKYLEGFNIPQDKFSKSLDSIPPIKFETRYQSEETPKGKVNALSVLGCAYEELGKKLSVGVKEYSDFLAKAFGFQDVEISAKSLDVNNDDKIDTAEYAASIIVEDMLSTNPSEIKDENITGTFNNQGEIGLMPFINAKNYQSAHNIFKTVYEKYNLGEAQKEFTSNPNNLI